MKTANPVTDVVCLFSEKKDLTFDGMFALILTVVIQTRVLQIFMLLHKQLWLLKNSDQMKWQL